MLYDIGPACVGLIAQSAVKSVLLVVMLGSYYKSDVSFCCILVIAKHLHFGRQEDAHEFLRCLIENMAKSNLHGYSKE